MGAIAKLKVDHLIGTKVGTSTILKELARGGMAIVFIAYQRTLKRQIALKVLPKKLLTPKTIKIESDESYTGLGFGLMLRLWLKSSS